MFTNRSFLHSEKEFSIRKFPSLTKRTTVVSGSAKQGRFALLNKTSKYYKRHRKRVIRYGLVFGNLAIVLVAVFMVVGNSGGNAANFSALSTLEESTVSNPLDKITATDVAAEVARMTSLPEVDIIDIDAARARANIESATPLDQSTAVLLPQVLSGDIKTKEDIVKYVTVQGDTLNGLATKYGVTSNSIRWSNGLTSSYLRAGTSLIIPPINGIVYKVKAGDTAEKLASKYHASEQSITRFNDAEVSGLKVGELIVIPGGEIRVVQAVSSFRRSRMYFSRNITFMSRYTDYSNWMPYGRGWCTDWASYRAAQLGNSVANVPGSLGDAYNWKRAGLKSRPVVGAVVYFHMRYPGHVGVVEEVSADGAMIKYSDMNGLAGWGTAAKTNDWIPASNYSYIY